MATDQAPLSIGTVLDGKFRITREVGRGGMAAVYEAENVDIGKRVAVKLLSEELAKSQVVSERFIREARAAAKVRSPFICEVYDVGTYDGRPFIVMELLEGESLYERLVRTRVLPKEEVVAITRDVAGGLAKAHAAKIVHRDLKPENIFLIRDEGGRQAAKILDFGLAKFYESAGGDEGQARLTKDGALFGTPAYMSPEQARADGGVDHRSDLWALGCIAYEMLTGRTVWDIKQGVAMIFAQIASAPLPVPSKLGSHLPESLDHWFFKALARDRDERFQDAEELAEALARALNVTDPHVAARHGAAASPAPFGVAPGGPSPPPSPPAVGSVPSDPGSGEVLPAPRASSSRRSLGLTIAALVIVAAGVAGLVFKEQLGSALREAAGAWETPELAEQEPYAKLLAEAQDVLEDGRREAALKLFEQAFEASKQKKAARSLLAHTSAALEEPEGPCRLSAVGHPRPFDMTSPSSRPTLLRGENTVISAWADNHLEATRRQTFTTVLDSKLRRISSVRAVTPEARGVRYPQLFGTSTSFGLLYWESRGGETGVYTRQLDAQGAIAGPPILISKSGSDEYYPSVARAADDGYWVLFSQSTGPKNRDIFAQSIDASLEPRGKPTRITALAPGVRDVAATRATAGTLGKRLVIVFAIDRNGEREVVLSRVEPKSATFSSGGVEAVPDATSDEENDRFLGQTLVLGQGKPQAADPHMACTEAGCLVAWDNAKDKAQLAYIETGAKDVVWTRELETLSSRPVPSANAGALALVWYHSKRVHFARVKKDGSLNAQVIAKISGNRYEPTPEMVAGGAPNQWLVTWRDFEAGNQEPFVARVDCEDGE